MKPKDKEKLVRNRGMIVRSLDVTNILVFLLKEGAIKRDEEIDILSDPRRRQRAAKLLDILEQKKTDCYQTFLEALEDHYPHIYLALVDDWDDEDDEIDPDIIEGGSPFTPARVDDEWSKIRKCRKFLIKEMDVERIMPELSGKEVFSQEQEQLIIHTKDTHKRTEAFLDIIELKSGTVYELFIEAVGKVFPHIYLMLTDNHSEDEDDLFPDDNLDYEPDEIMDGGYGSPGEYLGAHGYYQKKKGCTIS